jgi:hypothetical protein
VPRSLYLLKNYISIKALSSMTPNLMETSFPQKPKKDAEEI